MKRIRGLFVLSAMIMALVSCGKTDEQTQYVIDRIDSIGVVDYDDEELIGQIENEYALLTSEQRKKVENIDVLVSARQEIDRLIAARPFPFSIANWESTLDDLIDIYGANPSNEYDSTYGGKCYIYTDITYKDMSGLIRYFYNEEDILVDVRYEAKFDDSSLISSIYDEIYEEYKVKYGESGYKTREIISADNWYRSEGNIGISLIDTELEKSISITYLNKIISRESAPKE